MTLSGNLGFVPIDEILRLLTRSQQQGAVEVTNNGFRGRVFVGKGGIDLATTSEDDVLNRHLLNSGYTDEGALRRVTTGETTLAALADSNQAIVELLREMTVESLYQISHHGGDFEVREGQVTPYASPKSFELEVLLRDAQDRANEWAKVSDVVPDLDAAISLRSDLGERDEVSVKHDDWKVLSEVGNGLSVHEIADHLGTTEFWTARVVSRLVSNDLVELGAARGSDDWSESTMDPTPVADGYPNQAPQSEEPQYPEPQYSEPQYPETGYGEPFEDEEPASAEAVETPEMHAPEAPTNDDGTHDESWWQEPEEETGPAGVEPQHTPEVVGEGLSEIPPVESVEESEDVEEDTEAFLEKVFSELDSNKPETDEGHGLLRRRRMGTLRDFSSDS